jgi:hypothetical protein
MTDLLAYLLIGFVLHWIATQILRVETNLDWRWELAATIFWPIAAICGIILVRRDRQIRKRGAS